MTAKKVDDRDSRREALKAARGDGNIGEALRIITEQLEADKEILAAFPGGVHMRSPEELPEPPRYTRERLAEVSDALRSLDDAREGKRSVLTVGQLRQYMAGLGDDATVCIFNNSTEDYGAFALEPRQFDVIDGVAVFNFGCRWDSEERDEYRASLSRPRLVRFP